MQHEVHKGQAKKMKEVADESTGTLTLMTKTGSGGVVETGRSWLIFGPVTSFQEKDSLFKPSYSLPQDSAQPRLSLTVHIPLS